MCLFVCCDDLQSKYIAECLDEIKQELKQDNLVVKANAVNKLTYVSTHLFHQQVLSTLMLLSFTVAYYCHYSRPPDNIAFWWAFCCSFLVYKVHLIT